MTLLPKVLPVSCSLAIFSNSLFIQWSIKPDCFSWSSFSLNLRRCWVKPSLRSQCQMFPPGGVGGVLLHDVGHTELEQALPHDVHRGLAIHGELRPEWWYSYWSKSWRFSKPTSLSNSAWRCSLPGQPDIPQLWYWCNAIMCWHFDNLFTLFSVQFWMASPKL